MSEETYASSMYCLLLSYDRVSESCSPPSPGLQCVLPINDQETNDSQALQSCGTASLAQGFGMTANFWEQLTLPMALYTSSVAAC